MKPTQVIVVRHGQTEWNVRGRMQGHLDSPLTEIGIAQSQALAERLSKHRFTTLYSSDLGRACQTAQMVANKTGHSIIVDPRLRERKLGVFQSLTLAEIQKEHSEEYNAYQRNNPDYAMPQGESVRQRSREAIACFEELAQKHAGEAVVVITHGGVLHSLLRHALLLPLEIPRRFRLFNASLNIFSHAAGVWTLETWGDVSHLRGIGTQDDY